jgi:predicted nucleotidyltransferase
MDVDAFADRLAGIPGVLAIALGGSRARGQERPDSDWDLALYYRGTIDPDDVRGLGYDGPVVAPGEWAYPMNGGAWLSVDGEKVDLLYRDLDDVERWTRAAQAGDWELFRVPGYVCGMPTYALMGELATGRVLRGSLDQPVFPVALRESGPERWRWEADFALEHASAHARRSDIAACLGMCTVAVLATAHARMLERAEWVLNEKGLAARAGLEWAAELLRARSGDLPALVEELGRAGQPS